MNLEKYEVTRSKDLRTYEFFSEGPRGIIKKVVRYQELKYNFFNLVFGDSNDANDIIDDRARSNNNDRDKVLATVVSTVTDFMSHHPFAEIMATGSSKARTRLYQMGINRNLSTIKLFFRIYGLNNEVLEDFQSGKNYEIFFLRNFKRE